MSLRACERDNPARLGIEEIAMWIRSHQLPWELTASVTAPHYRQLVPRPLVRQLVRLWRRNLLANFGFQDVGCGIDRVLSHRGVADTAHHAAAPVAVVSDAGGNVLSSFAMSCITMPYYSNPILCWWHRPGPDAPQPCTNIRGIALVLLINTARALVFDLITIRFWRLHWKRIPCAWPTL